MHAAVVLGFLLVVSFASAEFSQSQIIDSFNTDTPQLFVVIPPSGQTPRTNSTSTQIQDVLGGERDISVVAEEGSPGAIMSAGVGNVNGDGAWVSTSTNSAAGFSSLQYDGLEGSNNIAHNGLSCMDLTSHATATGFLIQAQATFATDFKFTVYGYNGGVATVGRPVTSNEPTFYFISFEDFNGDVDFTCAGAIELTATIQPYSHFVVYSFMLGTYIPDSPSVSPTPSRTPSTTSTRSRVASSGITGPSPSNTPVVNPSPSVTPSFIEPIECYANGDCPTLSNSCLENICIEGKCVQQTVPGDECCTETKDCPSIDCNTVTCMDYTCSYTEIACIDSFSGSPVTNPEDDEGNGWIAGVVLGSVAVLGILICVVIVIVIVIMKKKSANTNSTSVYDAMIGDM